MQDFRDQEPLWVRYAEFIGSGSDKFYEVRIDLDDDGDFITTNRWGPRPDQGKGQIKTTVASSLAMAQNLALDKFRAKLRKGYTETERPLAASAQVAQDWDD
jgi:predicted DNA-binding WGR domain protein